MVHPTLGLARKLSYSNKEQGASLLINMLSSVHSYLETAYLGTDLLARSSTA